MSLNDYNFRFRYDLQYVLDINAISLFSNSSIILSLTVNKAKNGSHPSKFKGLGPFIFLRENRNVLNLRNFLCGT